MSDAPYVINVGQDDFTRMVLEASRHRPVLVDFWADWCGPCHSLAPILSHVADEYQGQCLVAKVNTDQEQQLAMQYGVRSLPTVKLFRNATVVEEFTGVQPESAVRELIERHLVRQSDHERDKARNAREAGDTDRAIAILEEAATSDPKNHKVTVELAELLAESGQPARARELIQSLPADQRDTPEVKALKGRLHFALAAEELTDEQALERALEAEPRDLEARYRLAARKVLSGDYEAAMDQLLEIMRQDRSFRDDGGRRGLLAVFDILGPGDPRVSKYRGRMFNLLY